MTGFRINKFAAIACAIILFATSARAAEPKLSVSVEIDKSSITVGDIVTLTVSAFYPEGATAEIPNLTDKLGGLFIRDMAFPNPERIDGGNVLRANYTITTYLTGDIFVPPVPITFTYKDSTGATAQKVIATDAVSLRIVKVSAEGAMDIKDIKPPEEIPVNWKFVASSGAIVLVAAILIGIAIYYFFGKKKPEEEAEKIALPGPPHEAALEELARIEKMGLVESGDFPIYYDLVTDTLRKYLGARYNFNAIDMTTDEVLESMNRRIRRLEIRDAIANLLRESDMVKFAKYSSDVDRSVKLINETRRLVHETTPTISSNAASAAEAQS